jgi:DNA-directed RNA polymerase subunit RPC12/RpoP
MTTTPWRVCRHCGRVYEDRRQLFDLYVAYALAINPHAAIDEHDPLDFCAACGKDFDTTEEDD